MQILKNGYFFIATLLSSLMLQADFIDVSVWKRQSNSGTEQLLVVCGDRHSPEVVGYDQAKAISDLLATYVHDNNCIILEDFSDIKGLSKRVDAFFEHHSYPADRIKIHERLERAYEMQEEKRTQCANERMQDALFSLPFFAHINNIPVHNIDFRTCFASIGPKLTIKDYKAGNEIIPWILDRIVQEISDFNDGEVLNAFYAERVARYKPLAHWLTQIMREQKLIFQELPAYFVKCCLADVKLHECIISVFGHTLDFIDRRTKLQSLFAAIKAGNVSRQVHNELKNIFTDLLDLSSVELIDAMIVHELYNKQILLSSPNIVFICAGREHTQAVQTVLPQIGYLQIDNCTNSNGVDIKEACEVYLKQCADESLLERIKTFVISAWCCITQFFI